MNIFIDTSAFFAVLDKRDRNHSAADRIWQRIITTGDVLLSHNYVLVEISALLQHRLGLEAVRTFEEDFVPLLNVLWIEEQTHRSAVSALLAASRRSLSLVDCASFEVMRAAGIRTAFVFDSDFKAQGFEVLA
ncbi:MAG: PIN domain-containing protein [Candidatus Aminicenantes bacterium]|nr:PIN domain-containing protein [Candidatus Aminicenantes bacterium]